ncbi:hypothetical protein EGX56_23005 [Escherichia coli]|nr:hypothetical protein [Escherichia coli]EFN7693247.1 hypothetical protein [Escherichia coli]EFN7713278.1 hypothetical protein [Escherichia coli]EFN7722941.1 hypothetical protein [Escherichia coli]EFN7793095.1 hypothetical protein [Escherichia coli]
MPSWRCPSLLTPVWSPHLLKQTPMRPMTPPNWRTMPLPFLRILHGFPTLSRSFRMSSLRKLTSLLPWPAQWLTPYISPGRGDQLAQHQRQYVLSLSRHPH